VQWYTLLLKVDPTKGNDIAKTLGNYPQNPYKGINLYQTFHIFGDWDICLWFNAETNDDAMEFVTRHIANIPGVVRTCTFPSTPIKTYVKT
jgi:uncharacterized protein with GYD domain